MRLINLLFGIGFLSAMFPTKWNIQINIIVLLVSLVIILYEIMKEKKINKFMFNEYIIFMTFWVLWSLLAYTWVPNVELWRENNQFLLIGFGYAILISRLIMDKKFIKFINKLVFYAILIHIVIGFFEISTGLYFFNGNPTVRDMYSYLGYPSSFFYNTNDYATFLMFGVIYILNIDLKLFIKNKNINWIRYALLISSFILIYTTDSRIILLMCTILFISTLFLKFKSKLFRILTVYLGLIGVSILSFTLYINFDQIVERIKGDPSGNSRYYLIESALSLLEKTDYRGTGAGNIAYYFENYSYLGVGHITTVHSWWIEILATFGIVFFIIYVLYYVKKLTASVKMVINENSFVNRFILMWLIAFIFGSNASSSIFPAVWIWIVNDFVFVYIRYKKMKSKMIT